MSDRQFTLIFYLVLLTLSGAAEYLHLVPMGTLDLILGGITVHGVVQISNGAFKKNGNGGTLPPPLPPPPSSE